MRAKKKQPAQKLVRTNEIQRAQLRPIGVIRSTLKTRSEAPKQGLEGALDCWVEVRPFAARGFDGLLVGDDIIVSGACRTTRNPWDKPFPLCVGSLCD